MADRSDGPRFTGLLHDARLQNVAWDPVLGQAGKVIKLDGSGRRRRHLGGA